MIFYVGGGSQRPVGVPLPCIEHQEYMSQWVVAPFLIMYPNVIHLGSLAVRIAVGCV